MLRPLHLDCRHVPGPIGPNGPSLRQGHGLNGRGPWVQWPTLGSVGNPPWDPMGTPLEPSWETPMGSPLGIAWGGLGTTLEPMGPIYISFRDLH